MINETLKINDSAASGGELGERLVLLRDSVDKYCSRAVHLKRARELRGTRPGYDRQVWREMGELGWLGTMLPEKFGGLGLGCAEMAVIAESLGRSLFPEPVVAAAVLAGGTVLYGDNDALKAQLLPALCKGELIAALASREETHSNDPLAIEARAEEIPGGTKLFGAKRVIVGGASADGFVVSARSSEGLGLYWLRSEDVASGLSFLDLADGRPVAEIVLDGVEIPSSRRIAGPGIAEAALTRACDEALIMTSAELLGVLTKALEITLEYLRTRVQFGKPIGSFQALQHRMVDLYIGQRVCRHALDEVLAKADVPDLDGAARGALASRIKARCADTSLKITREAVQMHGAMGYSDECDIGLFLMRAITLSAWLGGAEVHRRRFSQLAPSAAQIGS